MRVKAIALLGVILLLSGCKNKSDPLDKAIALRNRILESEGCSFTASVCADYGEKIYEFAMDCQMNKAGDITFTVTDPATISGIQGRISNDGGALTFDDKVLAFQTIADGQITPVTAPWLLMKTLRSGYLKGCTKEEDGFQIYIDDSYEEDAFHLNIWVDDDHVPVFGEIFWEGRRILTVKVENFSFL